MISSAFFPILHLHIHISFQGCGAETICFRSGYGSDFQKVPAPAPATALELPVITDFMLKRSFFMFLMKGLST
jgi:hypothetical protein